MIRPAGRSAISLRLSVTDRCQLRCDYCRPRLASECEPGGRRLSAEQMHRFVRALTNRFELIKVHLTGGEPLLRGDLVELVERLAGERVGDLALTTNGQLLAELAGPLRRAGLHRVNVSLDSLDAGRFARLTGGDLERTLVGLSAAQEEGFSPIKLNTVVLRGINDDESERIARFGLDHGCQVRFLELMPIGPAANRFEELYVSTEDVRGRLARAFDLTPLESTPGAASRDWQARDTHGRAGVIGFISPFSAPFCAGCRRLRLTSTGRLIGCLALGVGSDIRPLLDDEAMAGAIAGAVDRAMASKRASGCFTTPEAMVRVGG